VRATGNIFTVGFNAFCPVWRSGMSGNSATNICAGARTIPDLRIFSETLAGATAFFVIRKKLGHICEDSSRKKVSFRCFKVEELYFMNELVTIIFENDKLRVERIQSFGNPSPEGFWYDQAEDEWAQITKGSAVLEFEKTKVVLNTRDNYYIKAHERHRVGYVSGDCEWLCVFMK